MRWAAFHAFSACGAFLRVNQRNSAQQFERVEFASLFAFAAFYASVFAVLQNRRLVVASVLAKRDRDFFLRFQKRNQMFRTRFHARSAPDAQFVVNYGNAVRSDFYRGKLASRRAIAETRASERAHFRTVDSLDCGSASLNALVFAARLGGRMRAATTKHGGFFYDARFLAHNFCERSRHGRPSRRAQIRLGISRRHCRRIAVASCETASAAIRARQSLAHFEFRLIHRHGENLFENAEQKP